MNGMAIASLCCSIGTLFSGFTFILGIIFGHIALSQIKRQPQQEGYGFAVAGLVIGYVFLVLAVAFMLVIIILLASWPE